MIRQLLAHALRLTAERLDPPVGRHVFAFHTQPFVRWVEADPVEAFERFHIGRRDGGEAN